MQVVLVMFKNDGSRRSFSLHKSSTVVGRREDCDVRIPLGEISRKHCRLVRDETGLRIEDLGSSNGTYVNGQRVQSARISAGDTIQIGSVVFVVQLDGVPADDQIVPRTVASRTNATTVAPSQAEPTILSQTTESQAFDPASILDHPMDSGAVDALDSSAIAHDIAADLERVNRSR
ncbi:MAG: FHA domain-containing protein [Phycisphaerae bacterium]|nr:FHA domain-containing protein [Phycisphaerae bacterium]MDW8261806.1 FHA domain-containing protein [Phycisphaerales bacterium]